MARVPNSPPEGQVNAVQTNSLTVNPPYPAPYVVAAQTPLASEWDSAVIRQLAYSALALFATVLANIFGLSTDSFLDKGGQIIDAALTFSVVAWPLRLAYKARKYKANPPVTPEAIDRTASREADIARALTPAQRATAAKSPWIIGVLAFVIALLSTSGLTGCMGTKAAYKAAAASEDRIERLAQVTTEHYASVVQQADDLASRGLRASVLTPLQNVVRRASPIMVRVTEFGEVYQAVHTAESEADLDAALKEAAVVISDLVNAVKRARASAAAEPNAKAPTAPLPLPVLTLEI